MASTVLVDSAASIVLAAAAVGMFGGVRFSRAAGAAAAAEMKSTSAENFMVLFNLPVFFSFLAAGLGLLGENQLRKGSGGDLLYT